MKRPALVFSHLAVAALGGWLACPRQDEPEVPATPVAAAPARVSETRMAKSPMSPGGMPKSPAAWRAAWDEGLLGARGRNSEPIGVPDSINFFVEWCEVDPEGAVRGLSKTYAPGFSHNYLSNAVAKHGAILAPVLVKHYRDLNLQAGYRVEFVMGRALNALAKEDPGQAATLTGSLPPGPRGAVYGGLFDRQDRDHLDLLLKALPPPANAREAEQRSNAFASATDVADPEQGVWKGMGSADPDLRKAFAAEGLSKAVRGENWTGFFDAVGKMEPSAREEVREVLKSHAPSGGYEGKTREAISAQCRRMGLDDWAALPK